MKITWTMSFPYVFLIMRINTNSFRLIHHCSFHPPHRLHSIYIRLMCCVYLTLTASFSPHPAPLSFAQKSALILPIHSFISSPAAMLHFFIVLPCFVLFTVHMLLPFPCYLRLLLLFPLLFLMAVKLPTSFYTYHAHPSHMDKIHFTSAMPLYLHPCPLHPTH